MPVPKTPAFPLYGKDAYDDEAFSNLSWGGQGIYWFLAWWQWSEGSIPSDLEAILDLVPRRKIRTARKIWPEIEHMFPPIGDGARRANPTVERHRSTLCKDRDRRREGANITNEKRWGAASPPSLSDSLSEHTSDSLPATRFARQVQERLDSDSSSQLTKSPEGVQGEPSASSVKTPDFEAVARVSELLGNSALRDKPSLQIVTAWLSEFDEALIRETLGDCEPAYTGKGYQYLERILTTRRDNPEQRPGKRRAKGQNGNGTDRSIAGASRRPRALTIDDVYGPD